MKNIIFDLGGVVLKDTPSSILDKLDITDDTKKELLNFFDDFTNIDLGLETLKEKFDSCKFSDDIKKNYESFLVNYYEIRDINYEMIELINTLKKNNYNIYVLSDNNLDAAKYYKNKMNNIDGWIFSCDYNTLKKDEKLFKILIDKYNLVPQECYYIDDRKGNVDIALKYGIKGYTYNNKIEDLYKDMSNNGIIID